MLCRLPFTVRAAVHGVCRWLRDGERGQNMVEFALVVPMLAIFLFAAVEVANMFRTQIELDQAVRAGARYLSLNPSSSWSSVYSTAMKSMAPDLSNVTGTVSKTSCSVTLPEVAVSATYSYATITPLGALLKPYGGSVNSPDSLKSSSTMHQEGC